MWARQLVVWIFVFVVLAPAPGAAFSQSFPNKPIRMVTSEAGGGSDITLRLIAPGLIAGLGQQVVVDNRPTGVIPMEIVARAPADGYTLLAYGASVWLLPFMQDSLPYDPIADFSPIAVTTSAPSIIVVNPSLPVKSIRELIDLAKARPGELNYGSAGPGSITQIATELFKAMAGINIVHIPYRGSAPALNDLLGGQLQLIFSTAGAVAPHIKSGKLRALAVTSAQPSSLLPGLPTVAAAGLPGYEWETISGMFAPRKTPTIIIRRLNQEIVRVLGREDIKQKFFSIGLDTPGSSPEALAATMKSDMAVLGKVIRNAGIRAK